MHGFDQQDTLGAVTSAPSAARRFDRTGIALHWIVALGGDRVQSGPVVSKLVAEVRERVGGK